MKNRDRKYLPKRPEFDRRYAGWAAKFITKNRWKYESIYEFNDLMNDAYLIFRHIKASYPLITEPSHLMALFQSAMRNDLIDKAKYRSRKAATEVSLDTYFTARSSEYEDLSLADIIGENNNEGYLRILISELPPEVRMALEAFNDDEKIALIRKKKTQSKLSKLAGFPQRRETLNDILCKIIGAKNFDIVKYIKTALES